VTAVGGGVGQSVLRALRLSELPLRIVGCDPDAWGAGLYRCQRAYLVPAASDPQYVDRLLEVLQREQVAALIPGSDPELVALAAARERLVAAGVVPIVGAAEAVNVCRDKLETHRFFRAHGLPFAATAPAAEGFELADQVGFPLLAKPVAGSSSVGTTILFDERALEHVIDREDLILQEYLVPQAWDKPREQLVPDDVMAGYALRQEEEISTHVLLDHQGQLLGQFSSRNVLKHGVPLKIDPCREPEVEALAQEMARLLVQRGLVGPCNFQCKMTAGGPRFFEVNPRFTGITAVRAALGFNEVEAVLRRAVMAEGLESVRQGLRVNEELICSRYVTEMLVPRTQFEALARQGSVQGDGFSTSL